MLLTVCNSRVRQAKDRHLKMAKLKNKRTGPMACNKNFAIGS